MSALGQKQTSDWRPLMYAFPRKRTSLSAIAMSALCQLQISALQQESVRRIGRYFAEPSQSDFRITHGGAPCPAMDWH
jgi:hypothetical protein